MAINVADLEATISLLDELSPALKQVDANVKGFSKSSGVSFGFFSAIGQEAFQMVAGAARAAVGAVGQFIKTSTLMAVEAAESENLFEVSFGNMAKAAREWSDETAAALGLNAFELRKQSATLFTMADSMGVTEDKAYEMSTALTVLAGDMASFYNLRHEEAFAKIQAGISGESEPLKRLGIIVNETTIKHMALQAGLIRTGDVMDEATKVHARYLTIMDQTQKAQGDLARTIDSPANAMRVLSSQFDQFQISIGQAFVPALQGAVKAFSTLLRIMIRNEENIKLFIKQGLLVLAQAIQGAIFAVREINKWLGELRKGFEFVKLGAATAAEAITLIQKVKDAPLDAAKAFQEFKDRVTEHTIGAEENIRTIDKQTKAVEDVALAIGGVVGQFQNHVRAAEDAAGATEKVTTATDDAGFSVVAYEKYLADSLQAINEFNASQALVVDHAEIAEQALAYLTEQAQKTMDALGDPPKPRVPLHEHLTEGFEEAMGELPDVIVGALQGGGDIFKAVGASIGGNLGESLAEGLAGTLTGALGDTLGGAVGGLLGPLGALAGSAIGGLVDSIFGPGEAEKVNDMRDAFFEAEGGFEEFSKSMAAVSDEDWAAKIFNAETVEEFNALVAEAQGMLDIQDESWEATKEAAERYGLTIEELGPKFAAQELHEKAGQLLQDFRLLEASGADMEAVMAKMGPDVSEYIQQSIRAGVAVPEAMRPMLEAMIANGELLDENGDAYTSLEASGVTFAQTMDEMFTSLIEKIDQMVNALLGINDINVSPNVNIPNVPAGGRPGGSPDLEAQQGFYSPSMPAGPRSDGGTDVRVHPGEEVSVTPAGGGAAGGGGQPVQVQVYIGGEKLYDHITKASKTGQVRIYPDSVKSF